MGLSFLRRRMINFVLRDCTGKPHNYKRGSILRYLIVVFTKFGILVNFCVRGTDTVGLEGWVFWYNCFSFFFVPTLGMFFFEPVFFTCLGESHSVKDCPALD